MKHLVVGSCVEAFAWAFAAVIVVYALYQQALLQLGRSSPEGALIAASCRIEPPA